MFVLKNALITLSLGAALVVPNAALACTAAAPHSHVASSTTQASKHGSDDKSNHVEPKDHTKKVESSEVVKKTESKDETKKVDQDNTAKKVEQTDKDDNKIKVCPPKVDSTHKPLVTPAPTPTAVGGKGSVQSGQVLGAATAPAAVKTATSLPVTGAGTDIAVALAAVSALGAYQLVKRRHNA